MSGGKWLVPALVFLAGAVFGRLFGVKPLVRGATAVAALKGAGRPAGQRQAAARKLIHRKRGPARRSRAA